MDGILEWGLGVVRSVQTIASPAMTGVMKALSILGTEWFFLAALPLIYWCIDRKRGARISTVLLLSSFLNLWLKDLFAQPRPYQLEPRLGLASETSYGLPSGHAQGTAVFWGSAARLFGRVLGIGLALAIPFLVGLSRIYLGVHFPTDVLAGWAIGAIIIGIDYGFGDRLESYLARLDTRVKAMVAAVLALGMNALDKRDTSMSGLFLGAALGFVFVKDQVPFDASSGTFGKKVLRYVAGLAGAGIIYLGLKAVFPGPESDQYALFRFIRYALLGGWVSIGAPWVFMKLGLVGIEPGQPVAQSERT